MIEYAGYFDELHFTECVFNKFSFKKGLLIVDVEKGLGIMGDHPASKGSEIYLGNCQLIFCNVCVSNRSIYEYIGDPKDGNFKPAKEIIDGPFKPCDSSHKIYEIEGIIKKPASWVDWKIKAKEFRLKTDI